MIPTTIHQFTVENQIRYTYRKKGEISCSMNDITTLVNAFKYNCFDPGAIGLTIAIFE